MSESVRAVDRALEVLSCFSNRTPLLSMTQIAEMVGINKSTVHRLLATLEKKRFVERDPLTGLYSPGLRLFQLANLALEHNNLRRLAGPSLQRLCEREHENVNLAVLDDTHVTYIEVIESAQRVKLEAKTGQRLPAFCTASGKAILAFLPEEKINAVLEPGMPVYTPTTLATREKFMADMSLIRQRGFAISEQEYEDGINAIAVPVFNANKEPVASVSVAGPAYRLTRQQMIAISGHVIETANEIANEVRRAVNLE